MARPRHAVQGHGVLSRPCLCRTLELSPRSRFNDALPAGTFRAPLPEEAQVALRAGWGADVPGRSRVDRPWPACPSVSCRPAAVDGEPRRCTSHCRSERRAAAQQLGHPERLPLLRAKTREPSLEKYRNDFTDSEGPGPCLLFAQAMRLPASWHIQAVCMCNRFHILHIF